MLGFTVDVTLLYVVFPFFTYVPTSGWLGDNLPQVCIRGGDYLYVRYVTSDGPDASQGLLP